MNELRGDTLWELARPQPRPEGDLSRVVTDETLGEHMAVGSGDLHRVVRARIVPIRRRRLPEAKTPRVPRAQAVRPRRPSTCPPLRPRRRSRASGQEAFAPSGLKTVPTPGTLETAAWTTPGREASAITTPTPDQVAIFAAASFEAMPPLPVTPPGPPATRSSSWSISTTSSMSEASEPSRGSALSKPGVSVSRHEHVRRYQVGDERGEPVVVTEADLVVGRRIVLVHDRHHTELEKTCQRLARMQVLLAVYEVERRHENLARDESPLSESVVVDAHQAVLAYSRDSLKCGEIGWSRTASHGRPTGCDRPGGDEDD